MSSEKIKEKDFVLINYTGKVKETDEIIDSNIPEVIEENKLGSIPGPRLLIVGENWMIEAIDQFLVGKEPGEFSAEIPPERGFGMRDPNKVSVVPQRRMTKQGMTPMIGASLSLDGRMGKIRSIESGRVTIDFNHPLAGKTIIYDIDILKIITELEERILALMTRRITDVEEDLYKLEFDEENNLTIHFPEEAFYLQGVQLNKRGIASDIRRFIPEIKKIIYTEDFSEM